MNGVMCKGDSRLGTACGKCSRCVAAEALRPENQRVYPVGIDRKWHAELDAQRLRADTAEAEQERLRAAWFEMKTERDAAEQRISQLTDVERVTMAILGKDKDPSPGVDWHCHRMWKVSEVRELVRAALNPKPEAGSHE